MVDTRKFIYGLYSKVLKSYLCYFQNEDDCKEYMKNYMKNGSYNDEKRCLSINNNVVLVIHTIVLL